MAQHILKLVTSPGLNKYCEMLVDWAPDVSKLDTFNTFLLQKPRVTGLYTPFYLLRSILFSASGSGYPSEAFMHQAVRFMWYLLSSEVFSTKQRLIRAGSLPFSLNPEWAAQESKCLAKYSLGLRGKPRIHNNFSK